MKKENNLPKRIDSLTELHKMLGLPKPQHPLISVFNHQTNAMEMRPPQGVHVLNFYKISFAESLNGMVQYGQGYYDFDDGGMLFASPNQIIGSETNDITPEFVLLIHPDFLLGYPIFKKIKQYNFFTYSVHESLHLSEQEKKTVIKIFSILEEEINNRIDEFSQEIVVSQIELLLNYCQRFYKRQFITRNAVNSEIISKLDDIIESYIAKNLPLENGLPTVQYLSDQLYITPGYLSDLLRAQISQSTSQYIQSKFLEKAKEKLSTTNISIGEIAMELGYKHSQTFSKLFKSKTKQSPLEFRNSFN
ncbi:MAG: AraC family transcriptional regulator [Pseudopedobacter saltans]|uniref:AraC family transcriptional regulator n=1 Tax=Pseudopedobacter saltans TaxID=151895 RepID=A0A2W5GT14_9SPHI|nr:MAG: AraC family transcriptional regulator [Pseudopedobacter saltans]